MSAVHGFLEGLKPSQIKALERLSTRRVPAGKLVSTEVGSYMCALSRELGRQIGVFIDRNGQITTVAVGDADRILLPDFGRVRGGQQRFRGLRFVHTHLRQEPLSRDDITDLTKLRLDMIVALGVGPTGSPGAVFYAHLLPASTGRLYESVGPVNLGSLPEDFVGFISALEAEFGSQVRGRHTGDQQGRAVLLHVASERSSAAAASLAELEELAHSAGVVVVDKVLQVRPKPHPKFVVGEGKLEDVMVVAMQQDADLLVFDCELSGNQRRAIADKTDLKVIDRTQLILDIFAQRATSADGKLKVELAQLKYLLPRLGQKDDALSRLTGGIGGRGPGETKLEIGKRRARERIARLEKRLARLARQRSQRRNKRRRNDVPVVSIVGYTNAGKSTLLNTLTQSQVHAEDRLFATLETASRRLRIPREREVIVTDTVGFIRNLPKDLVDAFRATLEEMEDASLLLHVVDASDPHRQAHIASVEQVLTDLGLHRIPRLLVYNKMDLVVDDRVRTETQQCGAIPVVATDKDTLIPLVDAIAMRLWHSWPDAEQAG